MMTNHLFRVGLIMFHNYSHWKGLEVFSEETCMFFFSVWSPVIDVIGDDYAEIISKGFATLR